MHNGFQSILGGHLGCKEVSRHGIELFNDEIRPVHSALYQTDPTATKFAASRINRLISSKFIAPATKNGQHQALLPAGKKSFIA